MQKLSAIPNNKSRRERVARWWSWWGGGTSGVECSQLWCSASKLQKVSLRIARVTPFFSQWRDVSGAGVGGICAACTVSDHCVREHGLVVVE